MRNLCSGYVPRLNASLLSYHTGQVLIQWKIAASLLAILCRYFPMQPCTDRSWTSPNIRVPCRYPPLGVRKNRITNHYYANSIGWRGLQLSLSTPDKRSLWSGPNPSSLRGFATGTSLHPMPVNCGKNLRLELVFLLSALGQTWLLFKT